MIPHDHLLRSVPPPEPDAYVLGRALAVYARSGKLPDDASLRREVLAIANAVTCLPASSLGGLGLELQHALCSRGV